MLFQAASEAILSLSASKKFLDFAPGFTAVLHRFFLQTIHYPWTHFSDLLPTGT